MDLPPSFEEARREAREKIATTGGHLNRKEEDFLFLLAAVPAARGEILEIGSFKGRSTTLLALGAALAGEPRVVAVDPHPFDPTVPDLHGETSAEPEFRRNLERAGVSDRVEFHRKWSQDLAPEWDRPLRALWIDGDHSLEGARRDLSLFGPHLAAGGILALHDVLHRTPGPMRVFMEDVLLSEDYGACGLCGSIGWAQRVGAPGRSASHRLQKLRLWRRLARLLPLAEFKDRRSRWDRRRWGLWRVLTPHGAVDPKQWVRTLDAAGAP